MNVQFWKNRAEKQIDPDLFSGVAQTLAREVNQERLQSRDKVNKPTQIRKFYDEVMRYQGMVQASPDEFAALLPYIKMLNAKAAYANGRDLVGTQFKAFIDNSLKQIATREDFDIFCTFFEAFMGFYKFCSEKENSSSQPPQNQGPRDFRKGPTIEYRR
ncbi:type III-A CRISPR-associated protein Csm2 [Geoalkalibacter sp.]|uniref:type III-A CRISPR-associated protein Csm2 n=1 Tax=Geoalkalibacter sp. TaxID=3041440 RepID=UPI00272DEBDE|nr:type III-A CRISPR-associated protein Csm2 [Geoalkalibacter sp.]